MLTTILVIAMLAVAALALSLRGPRGRL